MSLQLEKGAQADLPAIVDCIFDAHSEPYHPFVDLLFLGAGHNASDGKPAAIERFLASWQANPYEGWVKVLDTQSGQVVG